MRKRTDPKTHLLGWWADAMAEGHEGPRLYECGLVLDRRSQFEEEGIADRPNVRDWDRAVLRWPEPWTKVYMSNADYRELAERFEGYEIFEGPGGVVRPAPLEQWWWWLDLIVDGRLPRPELPEEGE